MWVKTSQKFLNIFYRKLNDRICRNIEIFVQNLLGAETKLLK